MSGIAARLSDAAGAWPYCWPRELLQELAGEDRSEDLFLRRVSERLAKSFEGMRTP